MMEFLPNASHVISGMVQVGQNPHDAFGLLTARRVGIIVRTVGIGGLCHGPTSSVRRRGASTAGLK